MYAKGIQLYCAPTVDDRDSWIPSMRHIAIEGRCFVLSACQFLTEPKGSNSDSPRIRGGSCLVSPFGELLAGPVYGSEQILTAEIDLGQITRGKFDLDVVGHYARADVFQLHVNEAPSKPSARIHEQVNDAVTMASESKYVASEAVRAYRCSDEAARLLDLRVGGIGGCGCGGGARDGGEIVGLADVDVPQARWRRRARHAARRICEDVRVSRRRLVLAARCSSTVRCWARVPRGCACQPWCKARTRSRHWEAAAHCRWLGRCGRISILPTLHRSRRRAWRRQTRGSRDGVPTGPSVTV